MTPDVLPSHVPEVSSHESDIIQCYSRELSDDIARWCVAAHEVMGSLAKDRTSRAISKSTSNLRGALPDDLFQI